MTILQMALILLIFHRALRLSGEPVHQCGRAPVVGMGFATRFAKIPLTPPQAPFSLR